VRYVVSAEYLVRFVLAGCGANVCCCASVSFGAIAMGGGGFLYRV
jgi:hypothetical protein